MFSADHWELSDESGAVLSSLSYTEPASRALEELSAAFGSDYAINDYPADNGCGHSPARLYSWANDGIVFHDRTGLTTDPPYDVIPYTFSVTVSELGGVAISTAPGYAIGDDVSALAAAQDPMNGSGVFLLQQGGSYNVTLPDGEVVSRPWGIHTVSATDPTRIENFTVPSTASMHFC